MQPIFFKKFLRATAFLTASLFTINTLAWGQVALLPSGQPQPSISVPNPNQPVLIHLQDAHANYTAQKDMAQILERLRTEQGIQLVFVEGAIGRLDAKYLKFTPDPKLNEKIADELARMGELTAADLFLLKNATGLEFVGIENPDLYRCDIEILKKVFRAEKENRLWISENESALDRRITRLGNKDLVAALRLLLHLDKNSQSLTKTISTLDILSRRHLARDLRNAKEQKEFPNLVRILKLKEEEGKIDQEKALAEQKEIEKLGGKLNFEAGNPRFELERFYSSLGTKGMDFKKYPAFCRYARHLIFSYELRSPELFEEINHWAELVLARLAEKAEEKQAVREVKEAKFVAKLLLLELSRKEWDVLQSLSFRRMPESSVVNAWKFYELAVARESAFVAMIQKTLKAKNQSRAVIITGGFHTPALQKYFSDRHAQYEILSPRVDGDSHENYVNTMLGRKSSDIATSDAAVVPWALDKARAASLGVDGAERDMIREKVIVQVTGKSLGEPKNINAIDAPQIRVAVRDAGLSCEIANRIIRLRKKRPLTAEDLRQVSDGNYEKVSGIFYIPKPGKARLIFAPHGNPNDFHSFKEKLETHFRDAKNPAYFLEDTGIGLDFLFRIAQAMNISYEALVYESRFVPHLHEIFAIVTPIAKLMVKLQFHPEDRSAATILKAKIDDGAKKLSFLAGLTVPNLQGFNLLFRDFIVRQNAPVIAENISFRSFRNMRIKDVLVLIQTRAFEEGNLEDFDHIAEKNLSVLREELFYSKNPEARDYKIADQIADMLNSGYDVISVIGTNHFTLAELLRQKGFDVEAHSEINPDDLSFEAELAYRFGKGETVSPEERQLMLRRGVVAAYFMADILNPLEGNMDLTRRARTLALMWENEDIVRFSKSFVKFGASAPRKMIILSNLVETLLLRLGWESSKADLFAGSLTEHDLIQFQEELNKLPANADRERILEFVKEWTARKQSETPSKSKPRRPGSGRSKIDPGQEDLFKGSSLGSEDPATEALKQAVGSALNYWLRNQPIIEINSAMEKITAESLGEPLSKGLERFLVSPEELIHLKVDLWMWVSGLSIRLFQEIPRNILQIRELTQRMFDVLISPETPFELPAANELGELLEGKLREELSRADKAISEILKKSARPALPIAKTVAANKNAKPVLICSSRYTSWLKNQKNIIIPMEGIPEWIEGLSAADTLVEAVIVDGSFLWVHWKDTRVRKMFKLAAIDYLEISPDWGYLAVVYEPVAGKAFREYFYHNPVREYALPRTSFRTKLGDFEIIVDKDPTGNNLPLVSVRYPGFYGVVMALDSFSVTYASLLTHPQYPDFPPVPNYLILYHKNGFKNFGFAVQEVERDFLLKKYPNSFGLMQKISFRLGDFILRPEGYLYDPKDPDTHRYPFRLKIFRASDGELLREYNQQEFMEVKRFFLRPNRSGNPDPHLLWLEKDRGDKFIFLVSTSGRSLGAMQAIAVDVTDRVIAREDEQAPGFLNRVLELGIARAEIVSPRRNLRPLPARRTAALPLAMIVTESIAKAPHAAEDISDALAQYPGSRIVLVWNPDEATQFVKRPEYFEKLVRLAEKRGIQVKDLMTHQPLTGELKILLRGYATGVSLQSVHDTHNIPELKTGFERFKLDEEALRSSGLKPKQVFERLIHLSETLALAQLQLDGKLEKDTDGFWLAGREFFQYLLANYTAEKLMQRSA